MNKVEITLYGDADSGNVTTTYESEKVMLGAMDGALMVTQEHDEYDQETIIYPMARVVEAKFYVKAKTDDDGDDTPKLAVV